MKNYTDLNIILDRSGSMSTIKEDMIGGIEEFLRKESQSGDETKVSLFSFDDQFETVFEEKDINGDIVVDIIPRGSTALMDAVGKTTAIVEERISKKEESERPNRVLFMVITDGYENSSREYNASSVKDVISRKRENEAWDFIFLGAGEEDIMNQHVSLGISRGSSNAFDIKNGESAMMTASLYDNYQLYKSLDRNMVADRAKTFSFVEQTDVDLDSLDNEDKSSGNLCCGDNLCISSGK